MIGISLLTLVPGVVGGSETYARELCRALGRVGEHEYRVFLPSIAEDAADGLPARVVSRYPAASDMRGRVRAMAGGLLRGGALRRELALDSLAGIHFPLSVMIPLVSSPPAATTILDLQHEFLPENFPRWELAYRRYLYGASARRSRVVIAISEHGRETLSTGSRFAPERVRTIHLGVDLERFAPADVPREPFLFYPANRWPHKNHETLFRAVDAAAASTRPAARAHGPRRARARGRRVARARVRRTSSSTSTGARRRSSSRACYEGFGQPVLEALACGCPVACSDLPPLREVAGDAAVYFEPDDPESIAAGVLEAIARGGVVRARSVRRGSRGTRCARRHDAVYRELAT